MRLNIHVFNRRKWIFLAAICFALAALGMSFCRSSIVAFAYTPVAGVVSGDDVRMRMSPVNGEPIATLKKDTAVTVMEEAMGSDGMVWYQIQVNVNGVLTTGYMRSDFVQLQTPEAVLEDPYVTGLKAAGFPESYCSALLALHQKYPNWQFVPVLTGLDWNTAIQNESLVGRNLIQNSVNDARKSTDNSAYNWATNTWYGYDGANWVSASPGYIAYCMDPRNFLNEEYIFQFETLEYAPYQNATGVSNILANTFMSGNYTDTDGVTRSYADTFVEIGSSLAVSPYHLAARCKQEQGTKGTSPLISGVFEGYAGYYNYFNVRAYTTSNASATVNGLAYAKSQGWDSIYKSIAGGSAVVANNYVKKGQNTIYFEKFNVVYHESLYSHQYMTNVQAAMSEGSNMGKAYTDKTQAFVFRIPVYSNMPESPVTFADVGNPNNWLSSLTVEGYSLTPYFDGSNTAYSLVVGSEVEAINVGATAVAGTSTIAGVGTHVLNYGNNTINITCTSQSGVARTYTITVARQSPAVTGALITIADGVTITSAYPIGNYVTGLEPGTSTATVLAGIAPVNCEVKVLKADGTENTGNIGTGDKITIYVNGAVTKQYEAVVYGDINGDGKVSNVDLVLLQKQILGITPQAGAYMEAANTSRDGGVSNKDLVIMQKHILNISKISQQ